MISLNCFNLTIKLEQMRNCFLQMSKSDLLVESTPGEDAVKMVEMTKKDLEYYINLVASSSRVSED